MMRLLLLLSLSLVASCTREEIEEPLNLKVLQFSHDWNVEEWSKEDLDEAQSIEIYLKNEADQICTKTVGFEVNLDTSKIDPKFIHGMVKVAAARKSGLCRVRGFGNTKSYKNEPTKETQARRNHPASA